MPLIHNNLRTIVGAVLCVQLYVFLDLYFKLPGVIVWGIQTAILIIFWRGVKKYQDPKIDTWGRVLTYLFIGWLFLSFVRACFYAEGYWMWKYVVRSLFTTFFFVVILLSSNILFVRGVYRMFWRYFLPLLLLSFLLFQTPLTLNYLPYSTLLLFWGALPSKKRGLLLGIALFFLIANEQRNDIAKIIVASTVGLSITYLYPIIPKWGFKLIHISLLIVPLVLLSLGVSGQFNVFKMDEYIKGEYKQEVKSSTGETTEENLKADTRTPLYENVAYTMHKYNAWILGRSPAFGDEGPIGSLTDQSRETTGLKGRYGNEVQTLNIILWHGIIGAILYFSIYIRASYLAIYKSKNRYAKGVGIYVAFLWVWSFVWEVSNFEIYFMMNILFLGLCFSHKFRNMTEHEMKRWAYLIFNDLPKKKKQILQ